MHKYSILEIRFLQTHLTGVKVDGLLGRQTLEAMREQQGIVGNDTRTICYFIQLLINNNAGKTVIKRDGVFGPQTDYFFAKLMKQPLPSRAETKPVILVANSYTVSKPSVFDSLGTNPPKRNTQSIKAKFGKAGDVSNLTRMVFPYKMYYSGKKVSSTRVHKKSKVALEYIMEKTLAHYGQTEIDRLRLSIYGGCYSHRKMRGGNAQSTHSWGIALDLDPVNNRLRARRGTAQFARKVYQPFFNFVYQAGFISLGLERNYDWMHIQHTQ